MTEPSEKMKLPQIMGILNLTEDSFFDGGSFLKTEKAAAHFQQMISEGADIIDIGAESSRPGSKPVEESLECKRIEMLLEKIPAERKVSISIDTSRALVAEMALKKGVEIINDIYSLDRDPDMIRVLRNYPCRVVLMHMQGTPQTMQEHPHYKNVISEITEFFKRKTEEVIKAGIDASRLILDPGIGFGKTLAHNLEIMKNISVFKKLGFPVLLGPSRKSFIGQITGAPVENRLFGTAAAVSLLTEWGVDILRVHDVYEMCQVIRVAKVLSSGGNPS